MGEITDESWAYIRRIIGVAMMTFMTFLIVVTFIFGFMGLYHGYDGPDPEYYYHSHYRF